MLTPIEVRERLAAIRAVTDDPERAHGLEDDLRADVLRAIALGEADDPKMLASLALQTRFISFPRWYA